MFKKSILSLALLTFFWAPTLALAESLTAHVQGVVCAFCAQGLEKKFKEVAGVKTVRVDLDQKTVWLDLDSNANLTDEMVRKVITDAGYSVTTIERQK